MKKSFSTLLILLALSAGVSSQTRLSPDKHYFISTWGSVGYTTLLDNANMGLKSGPGITPSLGVGFRLYYNRFICQLGVEARYAYIRMNVDDRNLSIPMLDTELQQFEMLSDIYNCKDKYNTFDISLPILLGYEYRHFYFLTGVQLNVNAWGAAKSEAMLTTTGDYEEFIGIFQDMPEHFFQANQSVLSDNYNLSWKLNAMAHLEVGARLGNIPLFKGADEKQSSIRYYLSAFADFNINNIHKTVSQGEALCYKETDEGLRYYILPALVSDEMRNAAVRQLVVGVKFTMAFELPKRVPCVLCNDEFKPARHK